MRTYIASYGALAPIISALLMIFQSVAAPLPAFLITFTNGLLFGIWWGAALSWSSAMLGAALCFYLARVLGRPMVVKLVSEPALDSADRFFVRYGKHAIVIARLFPFVPFDPISYGAGLTGMRFVGFWVATGIGQLPATLLYSYLGDRMTSTIKVLFLLFGVITAVSIITVLVKRRSKVAPLLLMLCVAFAACHREPPVEYATSHDALSRQKPIFIDEENRTVWLLGTVQASAFNASDAGDAQYHAIVWNDGRAKGNTLFLSYASDVQVHQALTRIGAVPGDNLTLDAWDERFEPEHPDPRLRVSGNTVEFSVTWMGASREYTLSEILTDPGGEGFSFRFGGNLEHVKHWRSGCVACLYSCPGGKVSNANYTIRDYVDGVTHFQAREDLLPPDGSEVRLLLRAQ